MGNKLRQFGIRVLLLVTKSFVYLWTETSRNMPPEAKRAMRSVGRRLIYGLLFILAPVYQIYRRLKHRVLDLIHSPAPWLKPLSHRYALHVLIIIIAGIAVYSNVSATQNVEAFGEGRLVLQLVPSDEANDAETLPAANGLVPRTPTGPLSSQGTEVSPMLSYTGEVAFQPYLPTTANSVAPRQRVEEYVVRDGDTPAGIAAKFQIRLTTLLQTNNLGQRSIIRPGQTLVILPVDGVLHTVKRGETVASIAKRYRVKTESILSYNRLPSERSIAIGLVLIVPGGIPPAAPAPRPAPRSATNFAIPNITANDRGTKLLWPAVSHRINQYFTYRHFGLDIHGTKGEPIFAAENGVVVESRWAGAYGYMTLVKHDNGLYTRYGHATKNLTRPGQRVERGEIIALIGSTGRSTGPHVHFEVIIGSKRLNPLAYTR